MKKNKVIVQLLLAFPLMLLMEMPTGLRHIIVTQEVANVFHNATDRQLDRMNLRKELVRCLLDVDGKTNLTSQCEYSGIMVESVEYISSNKVVAVFAVPEDKEE